MRQKIGRKSNVFFPQFLDKKRGMMGKNFRDTLEAREFVRTMKEEYYDYQNNA